MRLLSGVYIVSWAVVGVTVLAACLARVLERFRDPHKLERQAKREVEEAKELGHEIVA